MRFRPRFCTFALVCDSSTEVGESMRSMCGKLNHLGLPFSPAKSIFGDGLRGCHNELFNDFYFALIEYFKPFLSVNRPKKEKSKNFYAVDSTTITLFSDIMNGLGRNRIGDGKKKGGLKVHMLTDVHLDAAHFTHISEAKQHNKKFLQQIKIDKDSLIELDMVYNHYLQFANWTNDGVSFVIRMKSNAVYEIEEELLRQ